MKHEQVPAEFIELQAAVGTVAAVAESFAARVGAEMWEAVHRAARSARGEQS